MLLHPTPLCPHQRRAAATAKAAEGASRRRVWSARPPPTLEQQQWQHPARLTCGPPPSARSAVIGRAAQQDDPPYEDEEPLPEDDIDEYFDDLPGELDQLEDGEGAEDDAGIDLDALEGEDEAGPSGEGVEPRPLGPDGKYPLRPEKAYLLHDLFYGAAYYDMSDELKQKYSDVVIRGLQSDINRIQQDDMYCCEEEETAELVPDLARQALASGASALILPDIAEDHPAMQGVVPDNVPVFYVESVDDLAVRLAVSFYNAPSRDMLMIHMLGSKGKTTTAWLVRGILEEAQQTVGMIGSIESAIAEDRLDEDGELWEPSEPDPTAERECSAPFMVTPYMGKYTLPEGGLSGLQTQKVLSGMQERGATCCVYEPSLAVIGRRQNLWTEVNVLVHTVLPQPSKTGLLTEEQRLERLAELTSMLDAAEKLQNPATQALVVNLDDQGSQALREVAEAVPHITYSCEDPSADVYADTKTIKSDIWETEVLVRTAEGVLQIITPLLGKHNVYNILAAVATGIALKVPLKSIVAGIEAVEIIPGRCEIVDEGQEFSVIVDGADTPQALEAMLTSFKGQNRPKRVITVMGCRGEEDRSQRALMAEVAHSYSDMIIFTNDSPRREPPENIVQDMVAGLPDTILQRYSGYVYFPFQDQGHVPLWFEPYLQKAQRTTQRYIMEDRFSAIRAAIGTAAAGDVVLLAGRGHSDCMQYDDGQGGIVNSWFDDRLEARAALTKLTYLNQLTKLSRKTLPWGNALDEMDALIDPPEVKEGDEDPSVVMGGMGQGAGAAGKTPVMS